MNSIIGIELSVIFYLIVTWINMLFAINLPRNNKHNERLYDRFHELIPQIKPHYADDLMLYIFIYFIGRWTFIDIVLVENFMILMGIIFIFRLFTFTLTEMPPIINECIFRKNNDPYQYWVFGKIDIRHCNDYMFSGHACHSTLILLLTLYYSFYIIEKCVISIFVFIEYYLILACRLHYSSDVIVGVIITSLLFYSW